MVRITAVSRELLADDGREISVAIVDSGFRDIPPYARIIGGNSRSGHFHGNRVLSLFRAPDSGFPLSGMRLQLVPYNEASGYAGLIHALEAIEGRVDILSMSMLWKDDRNDIRKLLEEKAASVIVPMPWGGESYPAAYDGVVTCCNGYDGRADFCLEPRPGWRGNSYAVPAAARLLACGHGLEDCPGGIPVRELFSASEPARSPSAGLKCPFCLRLLRTPQHTVIECLPSSCPYCGMPLAPEP